MKKGIHEIIFVAFAALIFALLMYNEKLARRIELVERSADSVLVMADSIIVSERVLDDPSDMECEYLSRRYDYEKLKE